MALESGDELRLDVRDLCVRITARGTYGRDRDHNDEAEVTASLSWAELLLLYHQLKDVLSDEWRREAKIHRSARLLRLAHREREKQRKEQVA